MDQYIRYHALDSLRAFLMLLGVFYHTAQHYSGEIDHALNPNTSTSWFFLYHNIILHLFRMPLFFVISGFLAGVLLNKKGVRWFLKNRLKRILLPFLVFILILTPFVRTSKAYRKSILIDGTVHIDQLNLLAPFKLMHLWFLYYLFIFVLCIVVIHYISRLLSRRMASFYFFCGSFVSLGIGLYYSPNQWLHLKTYHLLSPAFIPNHSCLETNMSCLVHASTFWGYFSFYLLGYAISKIIPSKLNILTRWPFFFFLGCLFFWLGYGSNLGISNTILNPFISFCMMLAITGFFQLKLSRENKILTFIADSSYWVYLVHYPVVITLCSLMIETDFNATVKYLAVSLSCILLSLAFYNLFIRDSMLGMFLHGKKLARLRFFKSKQFK